MKINDGCFNMFKLTVFVIALIVLFVPEKTLQAHTSLLDKEPAENHVVEAPPSELTLRFNEPIEHNLAYVTIYDSSATPVYKGQPDGDVKRSPLLEFTLPELKQGTYTVKWEMVSLDGHPVSDSYDFSVGKRVEKDANSSTNGDSDLFIIASRFITQSLLLLGAGLSWFAWLAQRQGFPSVSTLLTRGRVIGVALIILGTIAEFISYGWSLPPSIIQVMINGHWELLRQFPFVIMLFVQTIFLILLFIPGMVRGWYLTIWLFLAVTPAFGGHAWGMASPSAALILRALHLITIAFWLGALSYFILLLVWQNKQGISISWQRFRRFFVNKMIVTSGLVVVSGVVMVFLQTDFTTFFTHWTTWSALVVVKVALTVSMLSMAFIQTLEWRRAGLFTTMKMVRSEWLIGLVVILAGIWMSQIAYPSG